MIPAAEQAPESISPAVAIAATVILVALNGLFVAAEFALVRARPGRLRQLAAEGGRRAVQALYLVEHLTEALSVCQVGVTLCSLALGYLGEPAFARLFARLFSVVLEPAAPWVGHIALPVSIAFSFLLVTALLVILGEVVPKQIAIGLAERVLLATAVPLRAFWIAAYPLVAALNGSARLLVRGLDLDATGNAAHSREEIHQLLALSARTGQIGKLEVNLLENLFRFARRRTRDAMVPRSRVVALDLLGDTPEHLVDRAQHEGYSRYPVIEGDLDRVVGVLHVKDLAAVDRAAITGADLRRIARTPLIVPETLPLERLLRRFQVDRAHLALVADEFGAVVGIVALEDVLEELVGELRDEFDVEEQDQVRARPGGGWVLDPALPVDRAAELVPDAPPPPDGIHTLAGLVQAELGRIPEAGDRIPFGARFELVAAAVQGTRVLRVELVPRPPD